QSVWWGTSATQERYKCCRQADRRLAGAGVPWMAPAEETCMTGATQWVWSIAAWALVIAAVPAQAQETVRGGVTDVQGRPIAGAMIVIPSGTSPVARQLTDGNGNYAADLPSPGRYSLRVDRIGYQSTRVGPFEVTAGASAHVDVTVGVQPVVLRGLDVTGEERCA